MTAENMCKTAMPDQQLIRKMQSQQTLQLAYVAANLLACQQTEAADCTYCNACRLAMPKRTRSHKPGAPRAVSVY